MLIAPGKLIDYVPLYRGNKGEIVTQYDMKYTEMTGLIKFDFLGLKTLTVIDRALKLIEQDIGSRLELDKITMEDPKTFDLLCDGNSLGVFQEGLNAGHNDSGLNSEKLNADQGNPDPCIDHNALVENSIDNLYQT